MSESLDMSTASLLSQQSTASSRDRSENGGGAPTDSHQGLSSSSVADSSIPSLPSPPSPGSIVPELDTRTQAAAAAPTTSSPPSSPDRPQTTSSSQQSHQEEQQNQQQLLPLPIPSLPTKDPWKLSTVLHALFNFVFRNNNLPLLLNAVYHFTTARRLMTKPWLTVNRYVKIPAMQPQGSNDHRLIMAAATLATDSLRAMGSLHMALGFLASLALQERRVATERSALMVLSLAAAGQSWSHAKAYWADGQYTLRALKEIGSLDALVLAVSSVALIQTVRRTGQVL